MARAKAVPEWCEYIINPGVDRARSGILPVDDPGCRCVHRQYTRSRRPEREYAVNVQRLLDGKPYHNRKSKDFRVIHHALAKAVQEGRRIELSLLENADSATILVREQELIRLHGTLNRT